MLNTKTPARPGRKKATWIAPTMMIDDDTLKQPLQVAERKARHGNFISPYPTRGRPNPHSDRSWQEQITLMQHYKGYFITGSAMSVHPFSPDWYVGGSVLAPGRGSSIVEVTRFQFQRFTVSIKELAEWFGLEVGQIVV